MQSQDSDIGEQWLHPMDNVKDPRQFNFAMVCQQCRRYYNTTQAIRFHLRKECPRRPNVKATMTRSGFKA